MLPLAQELCEQLRMILEPTLCTQLKGDYRTGKRINMKKVIPYIASQYKKDKIWLRRTRPHKRNYQIALAIDDSESMRHNNAGGLALESLALIAGALTKLEVGELSLFKFGVEAALVRGFASSFGEMDGAQVLHLHYEFLQTQAITQFQFRQKSTNIAKLLSTMIPTLASVNTNRGDTQFLQIVFIISDGRFGEREGLLRWILEAHSRGILIVFIVVDNPTPNSSILDLQVEDFQLCY